MTISYGSHTKASNFSLTFDENNSPTENIISPQEKSIVDDINYEE